MNNQTKSFVRRLDYEDRVLELSRLIGGEEITETTINHAREILDAK